MIYVVILNWNGWEDTVACLQSLYATKGVDYRVIVCDNGSTDGSCTQIERWARGQLSPEIPQHPELQKLLFSQPAQTFTRYTRLEIESKIDQQRAPRAIHKLTLIENRKNLGFAAGNNPGIRYALAQDDMSHVWLLNNDTLVEPDCLLRMLRRLERETEPAICGSRVMFYDDPHIIQALGGNSFNRWTGNASQSIGRYDRAADPRDPEAVETRIDYISGCSMLIPRQFLQEIGLMEESYFLYYEEVDWAVRARGRYKPVYADDAVIYHKEGSAIGSASLTSRPSALSEFYCFRNKLKFTLRHFPICLPSCYLASFLQVLNRWRKGYWSSGWLILKVLLGKREFAG